MASNLEFVNYKEFVESLPARTTAKSGDKTVVSNSSDGVGTESKDVQSEFVLSLSPIKQLNVVNDGLPVLTIENAVSVEHQYINKSTHEPSVSSSWSLYKFTGDYLNRIRATLYAYSGGYELVACYSSTSVFNSTTYLGGVVENGNGPFDIEFFAPEGAKCILIANRDATSTEGVSIEISDAGVEKKLEGVENEIKDLEDWGADNINSVLQVDNKYFNSSEAYVPSSNWRTYVFDATNVKSVKAKVISTDASIKAIVFLSNTDLDNPSVISSVPFGTSGSQVVKSADVPAGCKLICVSNRYASIQDAKIWINTNSVMDLIPTQEVKDLQTRMTKEENFSSDVLAFMSKDLNDVDYIVNKMFDGSAFLDRSFWKAFVFNAEGIKNVFAKLISNSASLGAIVFLRNEDLSNPDVISYVRFDVQDDYAHLTAAVPSGCRTIVLCNRTDSGNDPAAYLQAANVYDVVNSSLFCGSFNFGETDYLMNFGNVEGVAEHFKMAMVKDGEVKYFLDQTNINKDINGNFDSVLDGTDGDMLIVNDVPIYTISCQGKNYSMRLFSLAPFTYDGTPCRKIECRGDAPSYCFVDNINENEHLDDHQTMLGSGKTHFVRNAGNVAYFVQMRKLVGKYVPSEVGGVISYSYDSSKHFREDGKFLPSVYLNQSTAENAATNKNIEDVVYTNKDVLSLDNVLGLVEAEAKTNYINSDDLFGNGFCSAQTTTPDESLFTTGTKAINGVRFKDAGDNWVYCVLKDKPFNDNTEYLFAMLSDWTAVWEIMEQHLVLSYAKTNNIAPNTWFVYNENEYKYINAGNLKGLADGVMTAVLFKKFRSKLASGVTYQGSSVEGNDIEYVIISSIYRGWVLDVSPHIWITGLNVVCSDSHNYQMFVCLDWRKYLMNRDYTEINEGELYDFEKCYTKYGTFTSSASFNFVKKCSSFSLSVPSVLGGSQTENQCGCVETDGKVADSGKRVVTGVKLGYGPFSEHLSRNHIYCWHPRTYVIARAGYSSFVCQNVKV